MEAQGGTGSQGLGSIAEDGIDGFSFGQKLGGLGGGLENLRREELQVDRKSGV